LKLRFFDVTAPLCGDVGLSTATQRRDYNLNRPGQGRIKPYGLGGGVGRALGVA
jgi:hypothetical protein